MNNKFFIGISILILLLTSGCTNKELDALNKEKEILTNEISQLKELISEKDKKIDQLEKVNSNKTTESWELKNSLNLIRFSSSVRDHSFDQLEEVYKIHSKYVTKDDWIVISDDLFQIELLEYENAKKVDFYVTKLESDEGPIKVFIDTDSTDGWKYTDHNVSEIVHKHKQSTEGTSYKPYFVIYTEVTLKDGNVIRTSKLPIVNK
ncbi:hypothetical protein ACFOZY_00870 [Chungangia koreensis]|uniref:Lipoprotein n=1 Tax=Chungangia koreensis TaxID=752657 RepID=A0ABV8X0T9_9LACT